MKEKNEFCKLSKQLIENIESKLLDWQETISESENAQFNLDKSSEYFDQANAAELATLEAERLKRNKKTLSEIKYALNKIKTGTYGICEESGDVIQENRLEANPLARYSLESQIELENEMLMRKYQ